MTAKEALRDRVDTLTEEEAEEWLARMEWESTEFDELTEVERADILAGRAEIQAGNFTDGEELFRKLGL